MKYWARVTFRGVYIKRNKGMFKMAHASCWKFRLSLLLGDRFSKEENKKVREESEQFKTTDQDNVYSGEPKMNEGHILV